ncbi:15524_t:CDS:1, partial [Entrophospora sp. SA101]
FSQLLKSTPSSPLFTTTYLKLYSKTSRKLLQPKVLLLILSISFGLFITCVILVDFQDDNEDNIIEEEETDD